ncbi:putative RNA-binding protein RbpA [Neochlamydia sp. EPS4]|nr:putative RNA-binding protein RbpA [Neochlamydia sp. EPS4]
MSNGVHMKKIFVGNLSWKASEETLKPLFEAFGTVVSIKIIKDQYTGKSKGFGFVEMEADDEAAKCIHELNEKPFLERNLHLSPAQERQPGAGGGRDSRSPRGNGGDSYSRGGQRSNRDRNYD